MMYRERGRVFIEIEEAEFQLLLFVLGIASGVASRDNEPKMFVSILKLANRINEGNEKWTPYEVGE
jgi:hypothetical protein